MRHVLRVGMVREPPTNLTPAAGSPLENAGTTRNGEAPTLDITGKARDASPDIGAYER